MSGGGFQDDDVPPPPGASDAWPPPALSTPPPLPPPEQPRPADPWAHRRGEPRLFALGWTIYVLIAVAGSILWVARFASVSAGSYGPAARIMLVVVAIGATVLWPMVRLSQMSPRGSVVAHLLADVFVILLPIQFVLWPLVVLANWPLVIVAGVAGMIGAWVVLTGGLLACALNGEAVSEARDPRLLARSVWMAVIVLVVGLGPMCSLVLALVKQAGPAWLPMISPISGIPALTGVGLLGPQGPVSVWQWESIGVVAGTGVVFWVVAWIRAALGRAEGAA